MGMHERIAVKSAAKERIKTMEFGDEITNVCAGEENPRRHAYFCQKVTKNTQSAFGLGHTQYFVKCTDKKGNFWNTDIEVIFKGHLDSEKCKELFKPIWAAHYS